jgi:hypothetical protein
MKYLGFIVDEKLSFKSHIKYIVTKLRKWVGIFKKIGHLLTASTKHTLYNSMFHPIILYGIELYGNGNDTSLSELQTLQNRAIKALFGYPRLFCTTKLYQELGIKQIRPLFKMRASLFLWSVLNKPPSFHIQSSFQCLLAKDTHKYPLRDKNKFNLSFNCSTFTSSSTFKLILLWNEIPPQIKKASQFSHFKSQLYKHYMSHS